MMVALLSSRVRRAVGRLSTLAAALILPWGTTPGQAQDQPISVEGSLNVMVPAELRGLLIDKPHVDFLVDVGEDGTLFDVMAIGSNHRDLVPAATKALLDAKLKPASTHGAPVRSRAVVQVQFYDPEQRAWKMGLSVRPFGSSASDAAQRRFYSTAPDSYAYGPSELDELDEPIANLPPQRIVSSTVSALGAAGRCLIEFYIDSDGRARFPSAIERDNDEVAMSAAVLLLKSRFTPPRRRGHRTYVKVQQEFIFR